MDEAKKKTSISHFAILQPVFCAEFVNDPSFALPFNS
jgi:hypothetical protein